MKRSNLNALWGALLVIAGVLALVQNFNIIGTQDTWGGLWGILFAIAGLGFVWWFVRDLREAWWAVIPGMTLLALAFLIAAGLFGFADANGPLLGGFFLAAIALSFWVVYYVRRDFWWAVIPGGVLLSVAAVAGLSAWIDGVALGAVMFFGMALTFGLVYLLPTEHGRMTWALIPAGVLGVMGVLMALTNTAAINYFMGVAFIVAGVALLLGRARTHGDITRHG